MPDRPDGPVRPSGPPLGGDREIVYRKRRTWLQRHLSAVIAVVVVVLVVGGIVTAVLAVRNVGDVAGDATTDLFSSAAPSTSPTPTASPTTAAPSAPAPATTKITGPVKTVVAPGQWTVTVQADLDISVVTTPATTYSRGRTAADVVAGTNVTVIGTMAGGVITATSVTIDKKASS